MKIKRRQSLFALIFSLFALVLFVSSPAFTKAIPPAGVRVWLFNRAPTASDIIQDVVTVVHKTYDINSYCENNEDPDGCSGAADSTDLLQSTIANPANKLTLIGEPLYAGDEVAVSTMVWLQDGVSLDLPVDLFMSFPTITSGPFTGQNITTVTPIIFPPITATPILADNPEDHGIYRSFRGEMIKLPNAVSNNSTRPDIIFSYVISLLPNSPDTNGNQYTIRTGIFDAGGTDPILTSGGSFMLKPRNQYIAVEEGNAFVNGLNNANKLVFNNTKGQTIVSNGPISGKCDWVDPAIAAKCDGKLDWIGSHSFANDSQEKADVARVALRQSLSKAVQEIAEIHKDSSSADNKIKTFLERPQTGVTKVKYPNGEVLLVMGSGGLFLDTGDINVQGKKLVIFSGYDTVNWRNSNINEIGGAKFASIVLSGIQVLDNRNGGPANYDGAYIALDISPPYNTLSRVHVAGDGGTVTINGMLVADEILINRTVTAGTEEIAKIRYDSAFQNGGLIGLSPFIRPLVSSGTTR